MQRRVTRLIDDLNGEIIDEDGETLRFGLDGKLYEIDLSAAHASELRSTLERYMRAGRRLRRPATRGQSKVDESRH